jgi:hypothetical protein
VTPCFQGFPLDLAHQRHPLVRSKTRTCPLQGKIQMQVKNKISKLIKGQGWFGFRLTIDSGKISEGPTCPKTALVRMRNVQETQDRSEGSRWETRFEGFPDFFECFSGVFPIPSTPSPVIDIPLTVNIPCLDVTLHSTADILPVWLRNRPRLLSV